MEFWALVLLVLAVLLLQCAEGTPHRHHPPHPRPPHAPTPPRSPPPRPSPPSPTPTPPRPTPTPTAPPPPPPPPSSQNCTQVSQLSEGPYWLEENIEASNVKLNLSYGVPLNITFKIVNGTLSAERAECVAIEDARIDIWQCRYDGLYSDEVEESTSGETWLRGYQYTNSTGHASFQTIYPGWYTSRTVHIHVRVRIYQVGASTASYDDTTQLYFDDTISEAIFANVYPYNSRGFARRDTYNAGDPLFRSANLITLTGNYSDPDGFSSLVELSLPFSNSRALSDGGDDENNHVQSRFYSIL